MIGLERKSGQFKGDIGTVLALDTKEVTDTGEFEGYASTYGNVDEGNDIMKSGAFDESLRRRPAQKVKMLWHHDTRKPIGTWVQVVSDQKGLFVRGKLLLSTVAGKETYELMKAGAVDGMSVGFRTKEYEYDRESEVRTIVRADLMEVSVVTFPMNELATINSVKNIEFNPREAERALRDAGLSSSDAVMAVSVMKKHLRRDVEDHPSAAARDENGAMTGLLETLRGVRSSLSS